MPDGVDISSNQADPDPRWYSFQGFVLMRALDRHGNPDPRFADRWEVSRGQCPRGAYGWPRPGYGVDGNRALGAALAAAAPGAELGLWADYESTPEYGLASVEELEAFLDGIGDRPKGVYANAFQYPLGSAADALPWWAANYGGVNDGGRHPFAYRSSTGEIVPMDLPRPWQIHQYTSRGGPGGSGLDLDYAPTLDLWEKPKMPTLDLDALPYIEAAHQGPRPAGQIPNLIVLHSGETNEGPTAAEGMANYFASGNTVGSAHICIDNDSIVRCAPDENRTNGAGGVNNFALHIEQAGRAGQLAEEWADPYSSAVVRSAAEVTRAWIAKYPHIQPVFLDAAALARGERDGITTHNEVSQVFDGNDGHWDPGPEYPIEQFLDLVRGAPTPEPEDDEVKLRPFLIQARGGQWVYDPRTHSAKPFGNEAARDLWVAIFRFDFGEDPAIRDDAQAVALLEDAIR